MPISEVFSADIGLGGVLSLLWFRRRLPDYATKFIEMILMVRRWTAVLDCVEGTRANYATDKPGVDSMLSHFSQTKLNRLHMLRKCEAQPVARNKKVAINPHFTVQVIPGHGHDQPPVSNIARRPR